MTRTPNSLREINPVADRAEIRRAEWELEATRQAGFWRRKRFDLIDALIFAGLIPCMFMAIAAFTH